jgi:AAA+ ATPase superfamily predicted ATPase
MEVALMKFYNRNSELSILENLNIQSKTTSKMTVMTGRRRVGKTSLSLNFGQNKKFIYFFISKKSEKLLCSEFLEQIKNNFDYPIIGEINTFKDLFLLILEVSKRESFVLVIDEFQEFININDSIYSEIQYLWDINKEKTKLNLIFIGSIYSLMNKIFQNSKEPLFGRADRTIYVRPFSVDVINEILFDYKIIDKNMLFNFYVFTGGIPRYIDILLENNAKTFDEIIDFMVSENSPFLYEGKNILIEEFGKEYTMYFSILELISQGKTSRSEIESILSKSVGGYLEKLEVDYSIIKKYKPIGAKPNSRNVKYYIDDNFLNFWFRYIYKNMSAIEIHNYEFVKKIIKADYNRYSGRILEKFFKELIVLQKKYNMIGSYWEKGNVNEIDIVAVDDINKELLIAEVKRNPKKINMEILKKKSNKLKKNYNGYNYKYIGLSLNDINEYLLKF